MTGPAPTSGRPGGPRRRIAFVRMWEGVQVTDRMRAMLERAFPEHEVETISLMPRLRADRRLMARAAAEWVRDHGAHVARGRRTFRRDFYKTAWFADQARRIALAELEPGAGELALVVQSQSLFDASLSGVPHAIYTDHVAAARRRYPDFHEQLLGSPSWQAFERQAYHRADALLVRSTNVARSLVEDYGCAPERVHVVYSGPSATLGGAPDNDGYANGVILFVGTDWKLKGGPTLVEAFRRVRRELPEATLTVVGCRPRLREEGVTVLGPVPAAELAALYARASVFCMLTRGEPFGNVYLEAMAHGLPVVGTEVGAVPDFVLPGTTGFLAGVGRADDVARHLVTLLRDPALAARLGAGGRELVATRYNWDAVAGRVRAVLEPILAR